MLLFGALLSPVARADASASVLCTGYSACAAKGYSNHGYATNKSKSYWRMYTGTNCTNYAAYRLVSTNGMPNVRPKSGVGNARAWGTAMASITDKTPAIGAIAWWGRTANHVAYIERVVSPTEILVSESNWSGAFDWRRITKTGSGWPDGFIHFADLSIKNTVKPAIEGTVKVGNNLKASSGSWSPTSNTYGYQWLADGAAIEGATTDAFSPTPAELDKSLSVTVSATRPNYPGASATSTQAVVAPGTLTSTALPAITGAARVDEPLTATTGAWSPTGSTYAYQWLVDGANVAGATGPSFTPGPGDVGEPVTVTVTASQPGYTPSTTTSNPTNAVEPGVIANTRAPTISGMPRVGAKLTARPGSWSVPDLTNAYRWSVGGAPRAETGPTYTPAAGDYGRPVTVTVTVSKPGYTTTAAKTDTTAPVARGTFAVTSRPTVSGIVRVGSRLTASTGEWSPAGTYSYQWYAGGRRLTGSTKSTLTPSRSELGDKLEVRVTARRDGYTTTGSSSSGTVPVAAGRISVKTDPTITGTRRLGSVLSVAPGAYSPSNVSLRYQWMRDGKALQGANARTRRIDSADLGRRLTVRVTVSMSGYARRTVTTAAVSPRR